MKRPSTKPSRIQLRSTRRDFLRNVAGAAALSGLPRLVHAMPEPVYPFQEIPAEKSGIRWVHTSGKSPARFLPETTGPGCAFLDYDNDGWMDIYLVNSGKCDFYDPNPPLRNALYRNNRDGTFTDVTEKARVAGGGYGQGVAVGDYDGDGFPDLYVTQYGRSILYHNNGDGTFTDVTEKAGVAAPGWSSSAVWFDYDNDGKLDLFVCQFVEFSKTINKSCGPGEEGKHGYCIPRLYNSMPSWLFHNNGDGTFTDVSKKSGIASHLGKAWGAVATDLNNDGQMDLFVSNDTAPNFVFMNRGQGRFEESGTYAGVAYSSEGRARSGMGLDSADFNQDGWMDLFVANIDMERFSIYQNNRDETFDDQAGRTGIGMATRLMSGWGLKFFDYDNDGYLDLFLANGNPDDIIESIHSQVKYQEPLLLFHNTGKNFQNVSGESGPVFQKPLSARGLAIGDFNNDGAVDVLVAANDGAPVLLRNAAGTQNHWLGINLVGTKSNRDAIGARITYQAGDLKQQRMKVGGGSFLSSHDPRVVLGIGARTKIDWVEIQWPQPSGKVERITNLPIDRYVSIVEGDGKWK
ncbi:MAG TPA: CRTAC1 family protein [Candidatus Sulfotelmatobacter sp.]|nr:CRTAC1 family protein [Candidatus Sulfotelmatobacter sp.]